MRGAIAAAHGRIVADGVRITAGSPEIVPNADLAEKQTIEESYGLLWKLDIHRPKARLHDSKNRLHDPKDHLHDPKVPLHDSRVTATPSE